MESQEQEFFPASEFFPTLYDAMPDSSAAGSLTWEGWKKAFPDVFERMILLFVLHHEEQENEWGGISYSCISRCMFNWYLRFEWKLVGNAILYLLSMGFYNRLERGLWKDLSMWFLHPHSGRKFVDAALPRLCMNSYLSPHRVYPGGVEVFCPTPALIHYLNVAAEREKRGLGPPIL